jgi:hypothetical protein
MIGNSRTAYAKFISIINKVGKKEKIYITIE